MAVTGKSTGSLAVSVAQQKLQLREAERQERLTREKEYTATLRIMIKRGVKGLESAQTAATGPRRVARASGGRRGPAGAPGAQAQAGRPLQILAEGDSWFDYGVPAFGGSIIPRLEKKIGVPILNLAKGGDEVQNMLRVDQRRTLQRHLEQGCPAGGNWDVLLFSGGGNDIVGDRMAVWMREFDPSIKPWQHVSMRHFKPSLDLLKAGYESLIALRDQYSPETHLIFHTYDYAWPDGRGVCWLGPWLEPTFTLRRFPTFPENTASFEVVKWMLGQFAKLMESFTSKSRRITVINGQGTLPVQKGSWHNELHPSKTGFETHADLFHQKLRQLFPGRVL
ncbi:MAG: SGNH/GDSL hydrolase family protein [Verrucomicrobiaceae bacterium]|nr:SGNH/GDSL hydrolase family protein [Verrucomicrobiaceae bacterium]